MRSTACFLLVAAATLAGCSDSSGPDEREITPAVLDTSVTQLVVSLPGDSALVGEDVPVTVTARDSSGATRALPAGVTLSVSDTTRAYPGTGVYAGTIRTSQEGDIEVIARAGNVTGRKALRVRWRRGSLAGRGIVSLTMGEELACGLDGVGRAWCWGINDQGQLGRGTRVADFVHRGIDSVWGGHRFARLQARDRTVCGVTTAGALMCWGRAWSPTPSYAPVGFLAGTPHADVAVGFNAQCGLATDGVMRCWGRNIDGELARMAFDGDSVPQIGAGDSRFSRVSLGAGAGCGITTAGATQCWGARLDRSPSTTATPVEGLPAMVDVEVSVDYAACGRTAAGVPWCWGRGIGRLFGGSTLAASGAPVQVQGVPALATLEGNYLNFCGLTANGEPWCWGNVGYFHGMDWKSGELRAAPARVLGSLTFRLLAAGEFGVCGVTATDELVCSGFGVPMP